MQTSHCRALSIRTGVLLECLGQIEALLHVIVVGGGGVDVPDAAVASLHFTVLLQSLKERERERVCVSLQPWILSASSQTGSF